MKRYKLDEYDCHMYEAKGGGWVEYENVREAIYVYNNWLIDNPVQVECNCAEHVRANLTPIYWLCHAHGYKERLCWEVKG